LIPLTDKKQSCNPYNICNQYQHGIYSHTQNLLLWTKDESVYIDRG